MAVICALVGVLIVAVVLLDAFEAVVLPRRVTRPYRLARLFYRSSWCVWRHITDLVPAGRYRQSVLSAFGPLSLLTLFAIWAVGLVIGFGLLHFSVAPDGRGFADDLYLSGTTFTTLGYGDVVPVGAVGRLLSVAEALLGFGFLAVVVGYFPVFYQAFSRRELTISMLDARAGSPPCAGTMLTRLPPSQGPALARLLEDAERWAAEVLESHLSYPVLSFYRSQHDNQSWLATLTCVLDAAALSLTLVVGADTQQARLTFAMARHAMVDIALVLRRTPQGHPVERLPPGRLAELLKSLQAGGCKTRDDESSVAKLAELRGLYEPFARALSDYLRLDLPLIWPGAGRPDNWQTSAGMRRAAALAQLGHSGDDHFQ
jgi:hypothetical protein